MPDAEPDSVLVNTSSEGITTITINRPKKRNAVDTATAQKLHNAFRAFDADSSQRVCIFSGSNGTFCAGYDLQTVSYNADGSGSLPSEPSKGESFTHSLAPMGPSRLHISKPVIAVVTGHAVAGGLELSLIADLRIAERGAVFGVFCRRWGVPLIDGGTVRLPQIIGLGRALDMILTGRPVEAQEALTFGLANRVAEPGKGLDEAYQMARALLQFPQACMNNDRRSAYYATYDARAFEDAMKGEFEGGMNVMKTAGLEAVKKFTKGGEGRGGSFERSKL